MVRWKAMTAAKRATRYVHASDNSRMKLAPIVQRAAHVHGPLRTAELVRRLNPHRRMAAACVRVRRRRVSVRLHLFILAILVVASFPRVALAARRIIVDTAGVDAP